MFLTLGLLLNKHGTKYIAMSLATLTTGQNGFKMTFQIATSTHSCAEQAWVWCVIDFIAD